VSNRLHGRVDKGSGRAVRVQINNVPLLRRLLLGSRVRGGRCARFVRTLLATHLPTIVQNVRRVARLNANPSRPTRGIGCNQVRRQAVARNVLQGSIVSGGIQVINGDMIDIWAFFPIAHRAQARRGKSIENMQVLLDFVVVLSGTNVLGFQTLVIVLPNPILLWSF
jgi:hypothetical protein